MNKQTVIEQIHQALENIGVICIDPLDKNTNLNELIVDSFMFISFIVELENIFEIQIPDYLLTHETISSLQGLADIIVGLSEENSGQESPEICDLKREKYLISTQINELLDRSKGDLSKEEIDDILVEIADKRTIIKDIECMIKDMQ